MQSSEKGADKKSVYDGRTQWDNIPIDISQYKTLTKIAEGKTKISLCFPLLEIIEKGEESVQGRRVK